MTVVSDWHIALVGAHLPLNDQCIALGVVVGTPLIGRLAFASKVRLGLLLAPLRQLAALREHDFVVALCCGARGGASLPLHYGEIESLQSPDAFASLLCATEAGESVGSSVQYTNSGILSTGANDLGRFLLRRHLGEGAPVACAPRTLSLGVGDFLSGHNDKVPFPNGPGNGLLLHPAWMLQQDGHLRGRLRGFYSVLHRQTLGHRTIVDGVAGLPGRRVMLVETAANSSEKGSVAFDITGPW